MPDEKNTNEVMTTELMVTELMIPIDEYPQVYDNDTLKDAINTLKSFRDQDNHNRHRSVLVFSKTQKVDNENRLVGILTIGDILRHVKKITEQDNVVGYDAIQWANFYKKKPSNMTTSNIEVSKMLRPLEQTFMQAYQSVNDAVHLMTTKGVNLLPVFDDKKAIGVVRSIDLLDYFLNIIN